MEGERKEYKDTIAKENAWKEEVSKIIPKQTRKELCIILCRLESQVRNVRGDGGYYMIDMSGNQRRREEERVEIVDQHTHLAGHTSKLCSSLVQLFVTEGIQQGIWFHLCYLSYFMQICRTDTNIPQDTIQLNPDNESFDSEPVIEHTAGD